MSTIRISHLTENYITTFCRSKERRTNTPWFIQHVKKITFIVVCLRKNKDRCENLPIQLTSRSSGMNSDPFPNSLKFGYNEAVALLSISFLSPFRMLPISVSSDFCAFFSSSMSSSASLAWSWCFNFWAERNRVDSGRVRRWYKLPKEGTREIPTIIRHTIHKCRLNG